MKSWLMKRLAEEAGIAAGVQIVQLDTLLRTSPPSLELSLCIEAEIRKIDPQEELWAPLVEYLGINSDRRVIALSEELCRLFQHYGKYGEGMLQEWLLEEGKEWQQELWRRIASRWPFLSQMKIEYEGLHLFGLSHLSQSQHQFCAQLPGINYYMLSPCAHFWSDTTSQRENISLQRKLTKKNWENLEEYLRDCNPLLANFGRLGREMAVQIEESETVTHENYFLPSEATLLQAIQSDLLLLKNPEEPIAITDMSTVQVHIASTHLREIQILHNNILALGVQPGDVLVMAPDIMEYASYIRMVFDDTPLKYQINDVPAVFQSSLIKSFMYLLSLSLSRWDAHSVWQIFEEARFQKKQGLTSDDLFLIQHWLKESRVLWGEDGEHRGAILKRNFCAEEMREGVESGTWEWAFGRLLEGLAKSQDETFYALPIVESTEMELLGKWISLMRALRADLHVCADGTALTCRKWAEYLQNLLESYFSLTDLNEADEALLQQLEAFRSLALDEVFTFPTILHQMEKGLTRKVAPYVEKESNVVRFSSMLSMRGVPADIVVLLGMHEGNFPKMEQKSALDRLLHYPKRAYCPSQSDFDRYLFLEMLLSARKALLISYQGVNGKDGEKQAPSQLVSELLHYCDKAYLGEKHVIEHYPTPFDYRYKSYSQEHYRQALAYYGKKTAPFSFIPVFEKVPALANTHYEVSVSALKAFAKNPLRAYFQKLGMYIREENKRLVSEEPFDLSPLEKYHIKNEAFEKSVSHALLKAENEGRLPFGVFKSITCQAVKKEIDKLHSTYSSLGIEKEALFTIELSKKVSAVERVDGNWLVPPLKFASPSVTMTGVLTEVCPNGVVVNAKSDGQGAMVAYPLLLVLGCLIKKYSLPIDSKVLFIKDGKMKTPFYEDAEPLLAAYLEYYLQGLQSASPFLPEFTLDILKGKSLTKISAEKINDEHFYNKEVIWTGALPDDLICWKGVGEKLYADLFKEWEV